MRNFWQGRRVFITGHTGFKGAWLWQCLANWGAELKGYALAAEPQSLFRDLQGHRLGESQEGDLRDAPKLKTALHDFKPEVVFHLAAQPLVLQAYQEPLYTLDVNVQGTAHLLEALRTYDAPCLSLIITTDKVYENQEWVYPYRETDALGGYDLYSASKACAELVVQAYRRSFFDAAQGRALATARAGNVIGGGDWAAYRILPDAVRAWSSGETLVLRRPWAVRPWQHVLEALSGYLTLIEAMAVEPLKHSRAYNFGPLYDEAISVEQVVTWAAEDWGLGANYELKPEVSAHHEAGQLRLDCSLSLGALAWRPRWQARKAVEQTMFWYRQHGLQGVSAAELCSEQLATYFS